MVKGSCKEPVAHIRIRKRERENYLEERLCILYKCGLKLKEKAAEEVSGEERKR